MMDTKALKEFEERLRTVELETYGLPDRVRSNSEKIIELEIFKGQVLALAAIGGVLGGIISAIIEKVMTK